MKEEEQYETAKEHLWQAYHDLDLLKEYFKEKNMTAFEMFITSIEHDLMMLLDGLKKKGR